MSSRYNPIRSRFEMPRQPVVLWRAGGCIVRTTVWAPPMRIRLASSAMSRAVMFQVSPKVNSRATAAAAPLHSSSSCSSCNGEHGGTDRHAIHRSSAASGALLERQRWTVGSAGDLRPLNLHLNPHLMSRSEPSIRCVAIIQREQAVPLSASSQLLGKRSFTEHFYSIIYSLLVSFMYGLRRDSKLRACPKGCGVVGVGRTAGESLSARERLWPRDSFPIPNTDKRYELLRAQGLTPRSLTVSLDRLRRGSR